MRVRYAAAAAVVVLAIGGAACSSDEPTPSATGTIPTGSTAQPSSEPPWGLDTIDMPDDAQGVLVTMQAFPETLDGLDRAEVTTTEVYYGAGKTFVRAIDLTQAHSEGFPSNVPAYLDLLADSGEVQVEDKETNPNAGFVYLVSTNTAQDSPDAEPRTTFDAAWGAAGGEWLFVASATSAEQREALANAFLNAASG